VTIAIDLGGSGSRLVTSAGRRIDGPALSGRSHGDVISALAHSAPAEPGDVDVVAVSAAGLISRGHPGSIVTLIRELWQPRRIVLASDAVAAVAAAWGDAGGAVVAAGTGAVALGTDFDAVWRRSDGWGALLGDEGSGAWIGARGLRAAMRAFDGRPGGSEALLEAVRRGHPDPAGLPAELTGDPAATAVLGAFAPEVSAASDHGDPVATGILRDAGRHLAHTGLSVLVQGVPERLALVGGLAAVPALVEAFRTEVQQQRPGLEVSTGAGSPLDGADVLARRAASGSLLSHPPYLIVDDQSHHEGAS
jgi:N-acetylglucosamine kinase-like BadF-type ATPase